MNTVNWEQEHKRFMDVAYPRTLKAAKRAFSGWHDSKQTILSPAALGKCGTSGVCCSSGHDPEPMISALIRFAIIWVRYDRKTRDWARNPDVYDYRSHMQRQLLSEQGEAPTPETLESGTILDQLARADWR